LDAPPRGTRMSAVLPLPAETTPRATAPAAREPVWARRTLIAVALLFLALFLFVPVIAVFTQALSKGWGAYIDAVSDPDALAAIKLTLLTAAIAVPLNLI